MLSTYIYTTQPLIASAAVVGGGVDVGVVAAAVAAALGQIAIRGSKMLPSTTLAPT